MIGRAIRAGLVVTTVFGVSLTLGCSSSDSSSSSKSKSFDELSSAIESPTGTVSATTVGSVATEFEKSNSMGSLGGTRQDATVQTQQTEDISSSMCTSGGSATATGSGSSSSGNVSMNLDSCCVMEACCYDGSMDIIYNTDGSGTSTYSYCVGYDLSGSCDGVTFSLDLAGCLGSDGSMAYSITVGGETYTVSGSYSAGYGTLTITGANGTWTCTYSDGSGSCTGTGGDFEF